MEWIPSFECHVRPDGEHVYRIGHQLIDEFLEFVVGRARPNTVRAYAHDLSVFFSVVRKDPLEVRPKDVMAFVTAQRRPQGGRRECGAHRRLGRSVGVDDQASVGRDGGHEKVPIGGQQFSPRTDTRSPQVWPRNSPRRPSHSSTSTVRVPPRRTWQ